MTYSKGVFWERELIAYLTGQGFSTARVAGSGHNTPADILAVRRGLVLAIECKAHANRPRLPADRVAELRAWCEQAGAHGFLAWRAPRQDWLFLPMHALAESDYATEKWIRKDAWLAALIPGSEVAPPTSD
ncbi:MAG: hypothetical protein HY369_03355 [Candidatus Aenigmarchaeota archaeon]|nr:hypothetical protein [Candidatus Aenigmarchaeota archaeon]